MPHLVRQLTGNDAETRARAVKIMIEFTEYSEYIERGGYASDEFGAEFYRNLKTAVPTIANLISDPNKDVRKCAVDAIKVLTTHGESVTRSRHESDTLLSRVSPRDKDHRSNDS